MLEDLQAIDWSTARTGQEEWQKAHGRIERRQCAVVDVSGPEWDGYVDLYGRQQALRVERERHVLSRGTTSTETAWCLTSLGRQEAGPQQLLALTRQHWEIENRLHYVRDFTYDEDRCRARTPPPPAQSRLPHQRRHLHRASQFLPVHARGEPVLCRPTASGPRCDPDLHAELTPQRPEPPIRARSRRSGLAPTEIPDWTGPIPPSGSRIFLTTHNDTPIAAPARLQPTRKPPANLLAYDFCAGLPSRQG